MNVRPPGGAVASDNSYLDLTPESRLRILVPLRVSNPASTVSVVTAGQQGSSQMKFAGYETFYFAIDKRGRGRVRLRFVGADKTVDGTSVPGPTADELPVSLPRGSQHIRLVYMIRQSQADHNMAVTASPDLMSLNRFTMRLKSDPQACLSGGEIFCSWVTAGVAVRPEPAERSH